MNCHPEFDGYGFLKGENSDGADVTYSQIKGCDSCSAEMEQTRGLLAQLDSLPEITPSPAVWNHLQMASSGTPRRSRGWVPSSMAAALLLAVLVGLLFLAPGRKQIAAMTAGKTPLYIEENFSTPEVMELTLPGSGTLLLRENTEIRFTGPRTLVLNRGEVLAEVGKGFEIQHRNTRVIVEGTRFGVKAGEAVYVLEGEVRVVGAGGEIELNSGEAATLLPGRISGGVAQIDLGWIPLPGLAITLEKDAGAGLRRGEEITWTVSFSSSRPFLMDGMKNLLHNHYLFLHVEPVGRKPYLIPIDPENILTPDEGPFWIGPGWDAVLTFRVHSRKFQMDGRCTIFASYSGKGTGGGQVTSNPVELEVRK